MNIIEMGQKAGLCDKEGRDDNSIIIEDHLERFAALVEAAARADEREECAKLMFRLDLCGEEVKAAEAIRARGIP